MSPLAVGVDVAEARKGFDLVALDAERDIVCSQGRLAVDEVVSIISKLRPAIVCIDSPSGWAKSGRSREAERCLAAAGISSFPTGPDPGDHPFFRWMRAGMSLFAALAGAYPIYREGDPAGHAAEVFPNATAVLLGGRRSAQGQSKVSFRRELLLEQGVSAGALPNLDRVDAAIAALTGLVVLGGVWSAVGDPDEGVVLVPVSRLQRVQRVRATR